MAYEETQTERHFEARQKNPAAAMWRELCATEITLGGAQKKRSEDYEVQRTARVQDFGNETGNEMANEKRLRLSLASPEDIAKQMPVVTLSTSD